jgi:hypothetical protein
MCFTEKSRAGSYHYLSDELLILIHHLTLNKIFFIPDGDVRNKNHAINATGNFYRYAMK